MRSSLASPGWRLGPWTSTRGGTRSNLEDMGQNEDPRAEYGHQEAECRHH